eukprot:g2442.t1
MMKSSFIRCIVPVLVLLLYGVTPSLCRASSAKRILVVLQDQDQRSTHSMFFEDLKAQGFSLTFKKHSDAGLVVERWGEFQFENVILFAPAATSFGAKSGLRDMLELIDSGRNVLMITNSSISKKNIDLASELGADFESVESLVFDHLHHAKLPDANGDQSRSDHSLLVVEPEQRVRELFDKRKKTVNSRPLLYRGIGHSVSPENDHSIVALTGAATSYSFSPAVDTTDAGQMLIGKDTTLISLMQTTNNGRVVMVGSTDFFSNELFSTPFIVSRNQQKYDKSGNREFCQDLVLWNFQLIGVLKTTPPRHYNTRTGLTPSMYTIMDPIRFELNISELVVDRWVPYQSNRVQIEYYMMDPYIRTNLNDEGNGTFGINLKAPDVYGVFKFLVKHKVPGYSNIDIVEMAPLRPFRHNEFERFILAAYPYYTSVFSMMIGFWILGILYLYHK